MKIFFSFLWVIFLYFSPESTLISAVFELGQIRLSEKLSKLGQVFDSCHIAVKLEFESIFQAI